MYCFEQTFNVPAAFICGTANLALYASGRTTGVVVEIGDSLTTVTPMYEGIVLPHGIMCLELGGRDITNYLMKVCRDKSLLMYR